MPATWHSSDARGVTSCTYASSSQHTYCAGARQLTMLDRSNEQVVTSLEGDITIADLREHCQCTGNMNVTSFSQNTARGNNVAAVQATRSANRE